MLKQVTLLKEKMDKEKMDKPSGSLEMVQRSTEQRLADSQRLADLWTDVLTSFMEEHFTKFATSKGKCESGKEVENLVRKWAYLVRLADWCYHEGILSRAKYMWWVINKFQETVRDPNHQASWNAELMLPLIINCFPDICRMRTELPELIRVCVNRYMRECLISAVTSSNQAPPGAGGQESVAPGTQQGQGQSGALPGFVALPGAVQIPAPGHAGSGTPAPAGTTAAGGSTGPLGGAGAGLSGNAPNGPAVRAPSGSGGSGGSSAGAGGNGASNGPSQGQTPLTEEIPLLVTLKKLVQSLLVMCPEVFISLHPEVQTAWRLIESDVNLRDPGALKVALRYDTPIHVPNAWLSVAMPWLEVEHKAKTSVEEASSMRLELVEYLDKCCSGKAACDVSRFKETYVKQMSLVSWQAIFEEHRRARLHVMTICGWAVSRFREHVPEATYMAVSMLKVLGVTLTEVFAKLGKEEEGDKKDSAKMDVVAGESGGFPGPDGAEHSEAAAPSEQPEYPLQGFLEAFVGSFSPETGYEEVEMGRLENLLGGLIRCGLFDHSQWILKLIAKGVFEQNPAGDEDGKLKRYHRLLAHLPAYPEAKVDTCQRSILLRNVCAFDIEPAVPFYALKVLRFLFWSTADLDPEQLRTNPGAELLDGFAALPAAVQTQGTFNVDRIFKIEWEESVNLTWLQHEQHHEFEQPFTKGILSARGQGIIFSSLVKILSESPSYVRAQLSQHVMTVIKVVHDRKAYEGMLALVDEEDIPENSQLNEELLHRAFVILECCKDSHACVELASWLIEFAPSVCASKVLMKHLRTVRALDTSKKVWDLGRQAYTRLTDDKQTHLANSIAELLCTMARQGTDNDRAQFEQELKDAGITEANAVSRGTGMPKIYKAVVPKESKAVEWELDLSAATDENELKESIKMSEQRQELVECLGQVVNGASVDDAADAAMKKMQETKAGNSALMAAFIRAVVNGTLKEIRSGYKFGCTGFVISSYVSLLARLEQHLDASLSKLLLHIILERMQEPVVVPAWAEDGTPSTVDSSQPQTPLTPATPESVPANRPGDSTENSWRQDATLALLGVLLARGLLLWEDVQAAVRSKLRFVVEERKSQCCKILLNLVELLLTDRRKGPAAMMPQADWQRLCSLRQTQPTHNDIYLMLKYIVQLACFERASWKQPALTCMQQVVQDSGFCSLASGADPRSFLKDFCRPCMSTLRTEEDVVSPFRCFSFVPGPGHKLGLLAAVQNVMCRIGKWSLQYDCCELRILVDAWKGETSDLSETARDPDGWKIIEANTSANTKVMATFKANITDEQLSSLKEVFHRGTDQVMEHHIVHMLLARIYRDPESVQDVIDFAKAMGQCFSDKNGMGSGNWFENQLMKTLLTIMSTDALTFAHIDLHTFFGAILHPTAHSTGHTDKKGVWGSAKHVLSFEQAVVQQFEAFTIPQASAQLDRAEAQKQRLDCILRLCGMVKRLVDRIDQLGFQGAGSASQPPNVPSLEGMQKAVLLRLHAMGAGLAFLHEDGPKMQEALQEAMNCVQLVLSSHTLMANTMGDAVYRSTLMLVDRVGSIRDLTVKMEKTTLATSFQNRVQHELLKMRLPRFIQEQLGLDLPIRNVYLTSGGFVRQAAGAADMLHKQHKKDTKSFNILFDVDPWLLIEDFSGVLSTYLAGAKKHKRRRLKWEYASPEEIEQERKAEEAAAAKEAAAAAEAERRRQMQLQQEAANAAAAAAAAEAAALAAVEVQDQPPPDLPVYEMETEICGLDTLDTSIQDGPSEGFSFLNDMGDDLDLDL